MREDEAKRARKVITRHSYAAEDGIEVEKIFYAQFFSGVVFFVLFYDALCQMSLECFFEVGEGTANALIV